MVATLVNIEGAAGRTPQVLRRTRCLENTGSGAWVKRRWIKTRWITPWVARQFAGGLPPRMIESAENRISKAWHSSSTTLAQYDHFNGIDQNDDIEKQAMVFYIIEIVLQLLDCILHRSTILITYLRPTGYPRLDAMSDVIKRNLGAELIYKIGPFRTGPDKTHIPC